MELIYTLEAPVTKANSIFLAGPTHRKPRMHSWRTDALRYLQGAFKDGIVYIPEYRNGKPPGWGYEQQIDWETRCLNEACGILFWLPRNMRELPGLTTNVEFGAWMRSRKVVAGAPEHAEHIRYIKYQCERRNIPWANDLETCINNVLQLLIPRNKPYYELEK